MTFLRHSAHRSRLLLALFSALSISILVGCYSPPQGQTPTNASASVLPSWRPSATRDAIIDFVRRTTDPASADCIAQSQRLAVFDNDGTLWSEQPIYINLAFMADRVRQLRQAHPEWETTEPFASILRGQAPPQDAIAILEIATQSGISIEEYRTVVHEWITHARNSQTGLLYSEMAYQPMVELLGYLRAHGYKTYIVSGGGVHFMRTFAEELYGIPTDQLIGTTVRLQLERRNDIPVIVSSGEINFVNDGPNKPIAIEQRIGRRPQIAFGNSDGDLEMLEWTATGPGPRLAAIIHHTDAVREWAYDRESKVGRLDRALDSATQAHWLIVDMAADWSSIFMKDRPPSAPPIQ